MDGVVSSRGAALGRAAEPPPQSDEHGGNDDEQAQGYTSDSHDVFGLHWTLGLKRRWAGWLESCKTDKQQQQQKKTRKIGIVGIGTHYHIENNFPFFHVSVLSRLYLKNIIPTLYQDRM